MGAGDKVHFARISDVVERTFGAPGSCEADADAGSHSRVDVILPPSCGPSGALARTQLIGEIAHLIQQPSTPDSARRAGLTLIGWLAERRPEEPPHAVGIEEARASETRLQAVRAKVR